MTTPNPRFLATPLLKLIVGQLVDNLFLDHVGLLKQDIPYQFIMMNICSGNYNERTRCANGSISSASESQVFEIIHLDEDKEEVSRKDKIITGKMYLVSFSKLINRCDQK